MYALAFEVHPLIIIYEQKYYLKNHFYYIFFSPVLSPHALSTESVLHLTCFAFAICGHAREKKHKNTNEIEPSSSQFGCFSIVSLWLGVIEALIFWYTFIGININAFIPHFTTPTRSMR